MANLGEAKFGLPSYPNCEPMGWFPTEFGLKDHSVFWYDGYFYLISNYLPREGQFAYGRSTDLCNWETLTPVLRQRITGRWDDGAIWSPYVYEEGGVYYLYYTGLRSDYTQSIMLATSTNPADPNAWQRLEMIFQPNHPGMVWQAGQWADCRDPTVIKYGNIYFLYYTGLDVDGGIVGVASASSPLGPFTDWGRIIPPINTIPESPTMAKYDNTFYLFYHHKNLGQVYRMGNSPTGVWGSPILFQPGWAHEIWQNPQGDWFTSFLTDHTVTISPLSWDALFNPPRPFIGAEILRQYLPLVRKNP